MRLLYFLYAICCMPIVGVVTSALLDLGGATTRVRRGGPIGYVPSTALLSSRAMLQSLGGFDESLRFGEDVDLVWRCEESGQPVWYLGEAEVEHPPRPGLRSAALQRFRYGRSAAGLDARHPGSAAPAAVSLWSLGGWVLTLRLRALRHPVGGQCHAAVIA